jgi:hypothetical protein
MLQLVPSQPVVPPVAVAQGVHEEPHVMTESFATHAPPHT